MRTPFEERPWRALALALAAGCGAVENPDLTTGVVTGRITGASGAGYAYVYGRPELRATVAGDGSYRIDGVPVGAQGLVLFDGRDRAELATVQVSPSARSDLSRDATRMPLAGRVLAAARPGVGFSAGPIRIAVEGTVVAIEAPQGIGQLFPVPAGRHAVRAEREGFSPAVASVSVAEGSEATLELQLDVDDGDRERRGCRSAACAQGLVCDREDGRCYGCEQSSDCPPGEVCQDHACTGQSGSGAACAACSGDGDCNGGRCVSAAAGGAGYCAQQCASGCPAGYACAQFGGASLCTVPVSCYALSTTFGRVCIDDAGCSALAGGLCLAEDEGRRYCTARCRSDADCPSALHECKETERGRLCER